MDDSALVDRARCGEEQAWAELVHRHHVAVYRVAFSALLRTDDAEDAAQEAWVAAWQRLDGFRSESSFRTWLLAIAWRKALDRRRVVVQWVRRLSWAAKNDDESHSLEALPDGALRGADDQLMDREERGRMARALRGVPRAHRDCLMLAAGGELTYDEIGVLLGIPTGTVKWRVSDGRKRLRQRLEGLGS